MMKFSKKASRFSNRKKGSLSLEYQIATDITTIPNLTSEQHNILLAVWTGLEPPAKCT